MEMSSIIGLPFLGGAAAPYFLTFLAVVSVFFIYFYMPYWELRKVPGPPTTLLVGHLPMLAKYGPDLFRVLAKDYGPVYRFHMGRQPVVIVADPELCKEVGIKKFKSIPNRSIPSPISGSPLHQKGLFFTRFVGLEVPVAESSDTEDSRLLPPRFRCYDSDLAHALIFIDPGESIRSKVVTHNRRDLLHNCRDLLQQPLLKQSSSTGRDRDFLQQPLKKLITTDLENRVDRTVSKTARINLRRARPPSALHPDPPVPLRNNVHVISSELVT